MSKNNRRIKQNAETFYDEEEASFYNDYVRTQERRKEKRIQRALKTRDLKELMHLEEEYE